MSQFAASKNVLAGVARPSVRANANARSRVAKRATVVKSNNNNKESSSDAQKIAIATLTAFATLQNAQMASAIDFPAMPAAEQQQSAEQTTEAFPSLSAPSTTVASTTDASGLPEGATWRYSEFIKAVLGGKVERVRFAKDGSSLQLTAVNGNRATVVLPNDPELVDILAKNGVDISVSEGEQQGNAASLLGNVLFPVIAFAGLFFLFRRAQDGSGSGGGMPGGMGGMPPQGQMAPGMGGMPSMPGAGGSMGGMPAGPPAACPGGGGSGFYNGGGGYPSGAGGGNW